MVEGTLAVGDTGEKLDTVKHVQGDGTKTHREVVVPIVPLSAFGELLMVQPTPQVQVHFPYNINTELITELHNHASSSASVSNGALTLTINGSASNFSCISTKAVLRYGPGQGALMRGTCVFTAGVAESSQVFGVGLDDEMLGFGYNGTSFGILHRRFGSVEIKAVSITAGADGDGGSFDIAFNGDTITVTVGASDTISEVVAAIIAKESDFNHAGRGWTVHTPDNIVVHFESFVAENSSGAFSLLDTDSGVTAGAFSEPVAGVAPTETWIAQTAWNIDKMDGTGPSGMTLDPTKKNVFQIRFQYLGGGGLEFFIEDTETTLFQLVHIINFAGSGTVASMRNPSLHLSMLIKTTSSYTGGDLAMKTSSLAGFIEGLETNEGIRHSAKGNKDTSGTVTNLLTILNRIHFQSQVNRIEVFPDKISLANDSTKTVTFDIVINPTQVDGTVAMSNVDATNSAVAFDTAGTTVVGGHVEETFALAGGTSDQFDLQGLGLRLRPGDRWVVTSLLDSGSAGNVACSIAWREK